MPVHIRKKGWLWTHWTKGRRAFIPPGGPTVFVAYLPYIDAKLPNNILNIMVPPLQGTDATTTVAGSIRITEQSNTRVTRGGNTRVTRGYTITSRPELVVLKLDSGVVNVLVADDKRRTR